MTSIEGMRVRACGLLSATTIFRTFAELVGNFGLFIEM